MKINVKRFTLRVAAFVVLLLAVYTPSVSAQEIDWDSEIRTGIDLDWGLTKNLSLNVGTELRLDKRFALDDFLVGAGLSYKTFGFLTWGAEYRLEIESGENTASSEKHHRYAFDATAQKKFDRFTPSLRVMYSNYGDEEMAGNEYLRYRAKVKYNIRKCALTPYVSVEAFQELEEGMLKKMRYTAGVDYKFENGNSVIFDYKFDFFNLEYKNRNIFDISYKIRF